MNDSTVGLVCVSGGTPSAFLNPMERKDDGDEAVGSLKEHDSAEESGKRFILKILVFKCYHDDLCALKRRKN